MRHAQFTREDVHHVAGLIRELLAVQSPEGGVFRQVLATYHFLESVAYFENPLYHDAVRKAKRWILRRKEQPLNPYSILAALEDDPVDQEIIRTKVDQMIHDFRLPNGGFLFSRRHIAEGQTFSTLIALKIFLKLAPSDQFEAYIESAFRYCFNNIPSFRTTAHLGFLVYLHSQRGVKDFGPLNQELISLILAEQRDSMWHDSFLDTAYLIWDLIPYQRHFGGVQEAIDRGFRALRRMGIRTEPQRLLDALRYLTLFPAFYGETFRIALRSETLPGDG
jgi:hypothetical protein